MNPDLSLPNSLESNILREEKQLLDWLFGEGQSSPEGKSLPAKQWSDDQTKLKNGDSLVEEKNGQVIVRSGETADGASVTGRAFLYPKNLGLDLKPGQTYTITGNLDFPPEDSGRLSINFYDEHGNELPAKLHINSDGTFSAKITIPKDFHVEKIS